jgi:hypothetical protein
MKARGFRVLPLGPDGPEAWEKAEKLNAQWDAERKGQAAKRTWPDGTLGWLFDQYRKTNEWARKKPRTREEWDLAWKVIEPVFADIPVASIDYPTCDAFYAELDRSFSLHKKHRVFKILRALLEIGIAFKLIKENPTHRIANSAPAGRKEIWYEPEVKALIAKAKELGYRGLALAIAIAYDTQMQPVDVRQLTLAMKRRDENGVWFETKRGKTERDVYATLSKETEEHLNCYLAELPFAVPDDQPFIRNRSGHIYSKDTLGDDFRAVRNVLFPGDTRRMMDLRRTGNVEAIAGGAQPTQLAAKLANTLAQSNAIFGTYSPTQLQVVRQADEMRRAGRQKLVPLKARREQK